MGYRATISRDQRYPFSRKGRQERAENLASSLEVARVESGTQGIPSREVPQQTYIPFSPEEIQEILAKLFIIFPPKNLTTVRLSRGGQTIEASLQ